MSIGPSTYNHLQAMFNNNIILAKIETIIIQGIRIEEAIIMEEVDYSPFNNEASRNAQHDNSDHKH